MPPEQTDTSSDALIPLPQGARHYPVPTSPSTVHRHILKGVGGVRLKGQKVGGRIYTRPSWIRDFLAATAAQLV